jgi:serine/threonine protein kinase
MQPTLDAGTEVSRYRVEELVARGGMGLVYRARDVRLDRTVALKLLSPELSGDERFRERFVRESRLTAAVDHPHVIPVYEADEWNDLLYIAMRFVRGVDMHSVLARTGPMDPGIALPLLIQGADALDAAHAIGLVHRDVKPGNFMLAGATADRVPPATHVYLTDFGLTKRATSVSGLTRTGQFLGSLHYVAPEQIKGEEVDARTDVYALACVAFEMLSGQPPFRQDQDAALLWAHMSLPPPRLTDDRPELPDELDDVLARGLAKERDERFESCGELVGAIRSALGTRTDLVLPDRGGAPPPADSQRKPTALFEPVPPPPATYSQPAPPAAYSQPAPETVQQRQDTPAAPYPYVAPPPGGGYPGGPPPSGGQPGGPPPWTGGGYGATSTAPTGRRRSRWPLLVAALLVVAAAVALVVWRPWAGTSLVTRDFITVPFEGQMPDDWQDFTTTGDTAYTLFGTHDWRGLLVDQDPDVLADAEKALTEDPESLIHVYIDRAYNVYTSDAKGLADQVQSQWPESTLVGQGTRQIDDREAFTASGVAPLGDGQVRVYAVTLQDDPRLFMLFICPNALYDEWRPTFYEIVDSVHYTG